jgi:hypothetical protein
MRRQSAKKKRESVMFRARGTTILLLTVALAAFTFGCSDEGGEGAAGSGGTAGTGGGGSGGDGGMGGEGGIGGDGGMGGMGGVSGIEANFATSLHNTRAGQEFWYRDTNGGFQGLVNVEYAPLTCQGCHDNNANPEWTKPVCGDCHTEDLPAIPTSDTCLGCHGRQRSERGKLAADGDRADVHTTSTNALLADGCASCHGSNDVHGNGTPYDTMLRPDAIAARCEDCHDTSAPAFTDINFHNANHSNVDCSLCHTETVLSCINCHFDTEVDLREKCAATQVFNWKFVMKWDKEGDGKEVYTPATMMTLKYNCDRAGDHADCPDEAADPKKTFAVLAPYYAHTVTEQAKQNILDAPPAFGMDGCGYCHGGPTSGPAVCDDIWAAGPALEDRLKLIAWDDGTKKLSNPVSGLIPVPPDFKTRFSLDFAEFAAGAGTACLTDGSPSPLVFFELGPDLWQTGADFDSSADPLEELGHPLSQTEFERFCPDPN